jgi:hypothetical protein
MNKSFLSYSLIQTITISSAWSVLGFLYSPQVLSQGYRNCAELQKYFNNKYPRMRLRNFEKVEMQIERSMPFQSVYATAYFCDGGTHVMSYQDGINRACIGYIVYYVSPYSNDQGLNENYYAGRGRYQNRMIEQKIENHCRQVI